MTSLKRMMLAAAGIATALLVGGCGGGGSDGAGAWGTDGSGGGTGTGVTSLDATASAPTIGSDGRTDVTITAFVKDASNRSLANQQVDFATSDSGSALQIANARTDSSGVATAVLSISDPTNRVITVSATSGGVGDSVAVEVVGTTLNLNGPTGVVSALPTEYSVALRDSSGSVLAGKTVSLKSTAGNTLSASSVTTDSAGQAKFQLTGTHGGNDTLVAAALGASASLQISVAASQLGFVEPAAGAEVPVSTAQPVSVTYLVNGVAQPGQQIEFLATRGSVSPTNAVTDANGRATVSIQSSTAGVSTLTARAGSVAGSQRIEFVSRTPAKVTVQPSPATVAVNLSATGSNSSQLIAVVRDAADNPVKGVSVEFRADSDPSNGRIEPAISTTDSSGIASVAFYPGPNPTGNGQIVVRATTLDRATVSGTAQLTAAGQDMIVRTGTGNSISEPDPTTYSMPWTALVTDSAGNPVAGATVQVNLVATQYYKGRYCVVASGTAESSTESWAPRGESCDVPRYTCQSEDVNENLRLDAGEDDPLSAGGYGNGDGSLTPGNVAAAVVVPTNGAAVTDSNGFSAIRINYPQEYGSWTRVRMTVTITAIGGTEARAVREFDLPVLASDLTNTSTAPPGTVGLSGSVQSPFGYVGSCRVPD